MSSQGSLKVEEGGGSEGDVPMEGWTQGCNGVGTKRRKEPGARERR